MESPTVLCINDLPQALELRKASLEAHGFCVKIASSGQAALKVLEKVPVAAVLLEYKMEGMDAEAVASHIKQGSPTCRSSCCQRTPICQSESCGWWMNT